MSCLSFTPGCQLPFVFDNGVRLLSSDGSPDSRLACTAWQGAAILHWKHGRGFSSPWELETLQSYQYCGSLRTNTLSRLGNPGSRGKHKPPAPLALHFSLQRPIKCCLNFCHSRCRRFTSQHPRETRREKRTLLFKAPVASSTGFSSPLPTWTHACYVPPCVQGNGVLHACAVPTWELSACKQTDEVVNVPNCNCKKTQMKPMGQLICFQLGTWWITDLPFVYGLSWTVTIKGLSTVKTSWKTARNRPQSSWLLGFDFNH